MKEYIPAFHVGDTVTLICDPKDNCVVEDMVKYHGCTTKITKIHSFRRVGVTSNIGPAYECNGVESSFGIPYLFTKDMLIPEEENA